MSQSLMCAPCLCHRHSKCEEAHACGCPECKLAYLTPESPETLDAMERLTELGSRVSAWIGVATQGVEGDGELIDPPTGEPMPGFVDGCESMLGQIAALAAQVKMLAHERDALHSLADEHGSCLCGDGDCEQCAVGTDRHLAALRRHCLRVANGRGSGQPVMVETDGDTLILSVDEVRAVLARCDFEQERAEKAESDFAGLIARNAGAVARAGFSPETCSAADAIGFLVGSRTPAWPIDAEGNTETCDDCGICYDAVYHLDDETWAKIHDRAPAGLLCPPCAQTRAIAAGVSIWWQGRGWWDGSGRTKRYPAPIRGCSVEESVIRETEWQKGYDAGASALAAPADARGMEQQAADTIAEALRSEGLQRWIEFAEKIAALTGCLASQFPDGNQNIIDAVKRIATQGGGESEGEERAIVLLEEARERLSVTCFCGELGAGHEEETEDHHACDQQLTCDAITKFLKDRAHPTPSEGEGDAPLQSQAPIGSPRPAVMAFALLMEAKLLENDHKGGWQDNHADDLTLRVHEEADELTDAVNAHTWKPSPEDAKRVGREAADVANMAMMVADVVGALGTHAAPQPSGDPEERSDERPSSPDAQDGERGCGGSGQRLTKPEARLGDGTPLAVIGGVYWEQCPGCPDCGQSQGGE